MLTWYALALDVTIDSLNDCIRDMGEEPDSDTCDYVGHLIMGVSDSGMIGITVYDDRGKCLAAWQDMEPDFQYDTDEEE